MTLRRDPDLGHVRQADVAGVLLEILGYPEEGPGHGGHVEAESHEAHAGQNSHGIGAGGGEVLNRTTRGFAASKSRDDGSRSRARD